MTAKVKTERVEASRLSGGLFLLGDGARIDWISFQPHWVYVTAIKDGRITKRRYRPWQLVPVIRWKDSA